MIPFLLELPIWLAALAIIGVFVGSAVGLSIAARYLAGRSTGWREGFSGLVAPLGAAMTAGFLVFAALLANSGLRDKDEADRAVRAETAALHSLAVLTSLAGSSAGKELRSVVRAYGESVLKEEWPAMSGAGPVEAGTQRRLDALQHAAFSTLESESADLRAALQQNVRELAAARQSRLNAAADHIPKTPNVVVRLAIYQRRRAIASAASAAMICDADRMSCYVWASIPHTATWPSGRCNTPDGLPPAISTSTR